MKVVVKRKKIPVEITTEYIKLESAMKLAGAVDTGGQAKESIQEGQVRVNGEVCTMRGRKLRPDDEFQFEGQCYVIHSAG